MEKYSIFFRHSVKSDFKNIPKRDLQRIMQRISALAQDPRPQGSEKLSGLERYRVRQGKYRIIYSIQDEELTVWVVKVGHRKDVYK
jgi:mRNA interferase RelE/StbE